MSAEKENPADGNANNPHVVPNHNVRRMELLYKVMAALGSDYLNIYLVDPFKGVFIILKMDGQVVEGLRKESSEEFPYEQYIGKYIEKYVHEEDREEIQKAASLEFLKKMGLYETSVQTYRKLDKGEVHYFQRKCICVDEEGHCIVGYQNVDSVVEKEREYRANLELALAAAERASRAKTTFLNSMSHDIRTPMNAIIGFTSLASTHLNDTEAVKDYLKKIAVSSNHLLSLINDVLDMSRIESGRVKIEEKPCHLPTIMHDLKNILQADVNSKRLNLLIDTVDVVDEDIFCDKLRLNQVLLNCMSNAVKYTQPGGTVGIRIVQKPVTTENYVDLDFIVFDSGIGMSEDYVQHIFEPFSREDTSTVNGIQGTGLGMSITKNIVDMMGGSIKVDSAPGKGSTFTISLRFKISEKPHRMGVIKDLQGFKALVADDNINTCVSVSRMLTSVGMVPDWTTSGGEAVLRAKFAYEDGKPYRVYIIDWLMPDMNGVEVVRRIRKQIGEETPIIILTAYDWSEIEKDARDAGVTAFCAKPLFLSELYDILNGEIFEEAPVAKMEKEVETFTNKRVLLVEDNDLNREIAKVLLTEMKLDVEEAENGKVALEMMKTSKDGYYDLILMDVQMPVMDGYEATRKIRKLDRADAKTVPILAVSANAFEEDIKISLAAGMNDHLAKPYSQNKIFEIMRKYL